MRNEKFMKKKSLYWQIPFLLLLIVGTWFIARQQRAASEPAGYQHDEGFVFGTVYSITYQSDANLKDEVESALAEVDGEFSMFNPQSTVARINSGDSTVERSEMFNEIYQLAQTVTRRAMAAMWWLVCWSLTASIIIWWRLAERSW